MITDKDAQAAYQDGFRTGAASMYEIVPQRYAATYSHIWRLGFANGKAQRIRQNVEPVYVSSPDVLPIIFGLPDLTDTTPTVSDAPDFSGDGGDSGGGGASGDF